MGRSEMDLGPILGSIQGPPDADPGPLRALGAWGERGRTCNAGGERLAAAPGTRREAPARRGQAPRAAALLRTGRGHGHAARLTRKRWIRARESFGRAMRCGRCVAAQRASEVRIRIRHRGPHGPCNERLQFSDFRCGVSESMYGTPETSFCRGPRRPKSATARFVSARNADRTTDRPNPSEDHPPHVSQGLAPRASIFGHSWGSRGPRGPQGRGSRCTPSCGRGV